MINNDTLVPRAFHQSTVMPDIFVSPICDMTRNSRNKNILKKSGDMLDLIGEAELGDRIMIHASAGMGKTYTMAHCVKQWQEGNVLQDYKHVFLLPVRKIRNRKEDIERVICHDLNIVPISFATIVRQSVENDSSTRNLILIDGYDELRADEKQDSIIADIISGKAAQSSIVVVTTRPEDISNIKQLVKKRPTYVDVTLRKMSQQAIYRYIGQAFPDEPKSFELVCRDLTSDYLIFFPRDFVSTPLFLAILCYICRISLNQGRRLELLYEIKTVGALITTFWGHMIRMKETGTVGINLCLGLFDENTPEGIKWMFSCVAKMSFDCLETGEYIFTDEIMQHNWEQNDVKKSYLSKLGPVEIFDGGMMFTHKLFQEYCAAHYVVKDRDAFKKLLILRSSRHEKSNTFEKFRKTIVFAVGINPKLLNDFPVEGYKVSLVVSREGEYRLYLSLESELFNECKERAIADSFLARIMKAPVDTVRIVNTLPDINHKAYREFLTHVTHDECFTLVKTAFPSQKQLTFLLGGHSTTYTVPLIQHPDGLDDLIISDPVIILVLASVYLGRTKRLSLNNIKPDTLRHLIHKQVRK